MELYHYGRKGMKWGQHIYGKERIIKRKSKTNLEDHRKIYKALTKQSKRFLTGRAEKEEPPKTMFDDVLGYKDNVLGYKKDVYAQRLYKIGKTPVAVCDAWYMGYNKKHDLSISIMTNPNYARKGYASAVIKDLIGSAVLDTKIKDIYWFADVNNTASNNLAKKQGFKYIQTQTYDNGVAMNMYKYKR